MSYITICFTRTFLAWKYLITHDLRELRLRHRDLLKPFMLVKVGRGKRKEERKRKKKKKNLAKITICLYFRTDLYESFLERVKGKPLRKREKEQEAKGKSGQPEGAPTENPIMSFYFFLPISSVGA